jgi:hypothetical protein
MLAEALRSAPDTVPPGRSLVLLGLPATSGRHQRLRDVYDITPVCDSYLVEPAAAAALAAAWLPLRFATNVQFVHAAALAGVEIFMSAPNVFVDGSKYGLHVSTLNTNNPLVLNSSFMEARRTLADPAAAAADLERVGMVLAASPFKNHPDFMHLRATLEQRRGQAARADVVFATAYRVFIDNNALMGSDSAFMMDYIENFRDVQDLAVAPTPASAAAPVALDAVEATA